MKVRGAELASSQPALLKQARQLVALLRRLDLPELGARMGVSEELAALTAGRYQAWATPFTPANARPALLAYAGDAYQGLDGWTLTADDLAFAQAHLRILSALYGLLRPLDLIQAYRLDMATRLETPAGGLPAFWRQPLTRALAADLAGSPLVNLASGEFFDVLGPLPGRVITPVFEDLQQGRYRVVSFHAKRARGLMCRYAIRGRISDPEALKGFDLDGYAFQPDLSGADRWLFRR